MPSPRATLFVIALVIIAGLVAGAVWQEHRIAAAQKAERHQRALTTKAEGERDSARAERDLARTNVRTVTQYVDRVEVIREAGKVITKEIPVYVTQKADAACTLPVGFVRIHDAAATATAPQPTAGDPDAPATGLTLSGVADTISDNYADYHKLAAQVIGLQDYILHACPAP